MLILVQWVANNKLKCVFLEGATHGNGDFGIHSNGKGWDNHRKDISVHNKTIEGMKGFERNADDSGSDDKSIEEVVLEDLYDANNSLQQVMI